MEFKTSKWIKPSNPKDMCETVRSPSMRCLMLAGHSTLMNHIMVFAGTPDGLSKFVNLSACTNDLTASEREAKIVEEEKKGEEECIQFQNYLSSVMERVKAMGLYNEWSSMSYGMTQKRARDAEDFDGEKLPDPNIVIPLFLENEWCEDQERTLVSCGVDKIEASRKILSDVNKFLPVRWACTLGNRKEALANLTVEDWMTRVSNTINPHECKGDSTENEELKNVKGYRILVVFHKTGEKFTCMIFLDDISELLGQCYYKLRVDLFGKPKPSEPFFVNTAGNQLIGENMNLDKWDEIINYPGSTSYIFRDMFVNFAFSQKDVSVQDAARFAACHSSFTQEKNYVNSISKQMKGLTSLDLYRKKLNIDHDLGPTSKTGHLTISKETVQIEIETRQEIEKERLSRRLAWQKKIDSSKPLTLARSVNEDTKVSFMEVMILEFERGTQVNKNGTLLDLFLRGRRSDPRKFTSWIMRALDMLPRDNPSVGILHNHFFNYCEIIGENGLFSEDYGWFRETEEKWAVKLVNQLGHMSRNTTDNPRYN